MASICCGRARESNHLRPTRTHVADRPRPLSSSFYTSRVLVNGGVGSVGREVVRQLLQTRGVRVNSFVQIFYET